MKLQLSELALLRAIVLLLASEQQVIDLSAEDKTFVSQVLLHDLKV
jgi:hypothetical protein